MRRATSMVFLGGWAGFFGTVSATLALAIVLAGFPGMPKMPGIQDSATAIAAMLLAGGGPWIALCALGAFLLAAAVLLLLLSMWLLQGREIVDRSSGERLAIVTLVFGSAIVAVLCRFGGPAIAESVSFVGLVSVLALSVLGILFDRAIEVEDEEEDDELYERTLHIARSLGRDVAMRPVPQERPSGSERGR
ncbi:hypothetical protein [Aureimonas psammosilenae]|uniref:hypothetical protein n=1 Tax=Aureimonas psammosilenae TaxID=2495496 RepID=UPI001260F1EB|nr:hypothetical protein [Aureimonas psammosilenae]